MNQTDFSFNHFYHRWVIIQSFINVAGLAVSIGWGYRLIWLTSVLVWFLYFLIKMSRIVRFPLILGYANWVTILRLAIVFILSFTYPFLGNFVLFFGFLLAIMLDGVDGYLARKFNQCSRIGECLDMECDAFLVLLISWIHYDSGMFSWWIFIPGGLRYYYGLSFFWLKHSQKEFPPKKVRATIAVFFFIVLIIPFAFSSQFSLVIAIIASILIILSFMSSIVYGLYFHLKN